MDTFRKPKRCPPVLVRTSAQDTAITTLMPGRRAYLSCITVVLSAMAVPRLHAQSFEWARSAGGEKRDEGDGIAVDEFGNSYVTGYFWSTATFGPFELTSAGGPDAFVAKYDSAGKVVWAKSASGPDTSYGHRIAVDGSANIYVIGNFYGTVTVGPFTLTSEAPPNVFVAKYDSAGSVLWATVGGGVGRGLAVDGRGHVLVTGHFDETASFGPFTLTSKGGTGSFVVSYDSAGNVLWATSGGGIGRGIGVDRFGNSYVTGYFSGTATFGSFVLNSTSHEDDFLAKYDNAGNVLWVLPAGETSDILTLRFEIAVDEAGNSYLTASFREPVTFGPFTLTSGGFNDVLVVKYDSAGNVEWARSAGGSQHDIPFSIAVDGAGNSYLTGYFLDAATFGPFTLTTSSKRDVFVAKYDTAGNVLWAQSAGGAYAAEPYGIAVDGFGHTYLTGVFGFTVSFGPHSLASAGSLDVFVAKLGRGLGACCDRLNGLCSDHVLEEDCAPGTLMCEAQCEFHPDLACEEIDPPCDAALGACCDRAAAAPFATDGTCKITTKAQCESCESQQCAWTKNASCENIECDANFVAIPTISEWGLVVLTLLLLIEANIHFGRRAGLLSGGENAR